MATTVPLRSYSVFYSQGLSLLSTLTVTPCTSFPISATIAPGVFTTGTLPTGIVGSTYVPPFAGPTPVFQIGTPGEGDLLLDTDNSVRIDNTGVDGPNINNPVFNDGIDINSYMVTPDGNLMSYETNYIVYLNVTLEQALLCPVNLFVTLNAAPNTSMIPEGMVTGPWIAEGNIGLVLSGWGFATCGPISDGDLMYAYPIQCGPPELCVIQGLGVDLLENTAQLISASVAADEFESLISSISSAATATPTYFNVTIPFNTSTFTLTPTDPVQFVRTFFLEADYQDFCSYELGFITTSTLIANYTTVISTALSLTTTTTTQTIFSSELIRTMSTVLFVPTTITRTIFATSTFVIPLTVHTVVTNTQTNTIQGMVGFINFTTVVSTETRLFSTVIYTTTTAMVKVKRASITKAASQVVAATTKALSEIDIERAPKQAVTAPAVILPVEGVVVPRTQAASLTPSQVSQYAPSVIGSACSLFFSDLSSMGSTVGTTSTLITVTSMTTSITLSTTSITSSTTSTTTSTGTGTVTVIQYTATSSPTITNTATLTNFVSAKSITTVTGTQIETVVKALDVTIRRYIHEVSTTTATSTITSVVCSASIEDTRFQNISGTGIGGDWRQSIVLANPDDAAELSAKTDMGVGTLFCKAANLALYPVNYVSILQNIKLCPGTTYDFSLAYYFQYSAYAPQDGRASSFYAYDRFEGLIDNQYILQVNGRTAGVSVRGSERGPNVANFQFTPTKAGNLLVFRLICSSSSRGSLDRENRVYLLDLSINPR